MMRIPWRLQLVLVACGYLSVLAIAATLIVVRYFQYATHPADVAAYGGMWAGGDLMLELFICGMLLVMSFFLVLVIFRHEAAYTTYSKAVLAISVTSPVSVGLIALTSSSEGVSVLGWVCLFRVFSSPIVLLGLGMSRLFARFPQGKRFTNYALLIETSTLILMGLFLVGLAHLGPH